MSLQQRVSSEGHQSRALESWWNEKAQNDPMPCSCIYELWDPDGSEGASTSLSVAEFLALTGGIPSDQDKREQDRRARIQSIEEDDAAF